MQTVLKSPNDKRNYYTYDLPNDLRVFIITDNDIDLASAAMLVKIGYYCDTVPGIAHFLEHMLFTGTQKFPEENHFSSFVAKHNGTHNAYTAYDHTCYYFSSTEEGFGVALDNFGDFFVSPNLNKNTIDREKEAIHSEHIKNINDDAWRAHEIIKVAGTDNHPFKKFGTGSNETLNVNNIGQIVRDFFEKHYSANNMTLIVMIPENLLQQIKTLIDQIFGQITNKDCQNYNNMISMLKKEKILSPPKIIKYVPIENQNQLVLTWEIPFYKDSPTQSPLEFLFYLISNESKNSIHYILSRAGYIIGFYCHVREIIYNKCLFCIDIKLSPFGQNNKKQVIATVIEYIKLLRNSINDDALEKLYYDQLKLAVYKFKNHEKTNSLDAVLDICSLINDYNFDPKYINVISILQDDYSDQVKKNMKEILDQITTDNLVIISGSKAYEDMNAKVFPHYGTKYSVENKKINYKNTLPIPTLPSPNPFISVNSNILDFDVKQPILFDSNKITSYWWPNTDFNTPDICLIVKFDLQLSMRHVYLYTCMMLYLNSILTEINSDVYLCQAASYNFSLGYDMGSIYFKLMGNYGKFIDVLNYLLSAITNPTIITDKSFDAAKYSFISSDDNKLCDAAYEKVIELFAKITSKYYYNENDRLKILKNITKKDVINVFNRLFPFKKILLYTSGNCSKEMFTNINSLFESLMKDTKAYNNIDLYKIHQTNKKLKIINNNKLEENVAVGFYVYLGYFKDRSAALPRRPEGQAATQQNDTIDDTIDDKSSGEATRPLGRRGSAATDLVTRPLGRRGSAATDLVTRPLGRRGSVATDLICLSNLLDNLIANEYFDQLRTKESFGYIVSSKIITKGEKSQCGYYLFMVQSPNKTVEEITNRTIEFINYFADKLNKFSENDFETAKMSYISTLKTNFSNLLELSAFTFTSEIETEYLKFDYKNVLQEECQKLTLKDLQDFYMDKFVNSRIEIIIQLDKQKKNNMKGGAIIENNNFVLPELRMGCTHCSTR